MTVSLQTPSLQHALLIQAQSHDPTDFVLKAGQMSESNILFPYGRPTINKATKQAIGIIPYE
jgi:hypothetical protein